MKQFDRTALQGETKQQYERMQAAPVTVLQIGEGNFLRGFFDWMIHECRKQGLFQGSIAVVQPRPSGKDNIGKLAAQDGLYTLVTRGMDKGTAVARNELIPVFSQVFDPYTDWEKLTELAVSPQLTFVVSNTTEAGLVYRAEPLGEGPILSFPGKITYLLYLRYQAYQGSSTHGLIFLPCELLEGNGDVLRETVLHYAEDWNLPQTFQDWVRLHNRFLNSLVDRIVTGYPEEEQAEAWFEEWGVRDNMLCTAEPYHVWAIEAEPEMENILPFRTAGLNVHWTSDLKPFRERKVRLLNGAHTWMASLGLIHGLEHVREMLEHPDFGWRVREAAVKEIIPALPYPKEELLTYSREVFDRFANPYIRHRLSDIAMNSVSKFRVRLLPSLAYYAERRAPLPEQLILGLSGLLRYYRVKLMEDGTYAGTNLSGEQYTVRDDPEALNLVAGIWSATELTGATMKETVDRLLALELLWGQSLAKWDGLTTAVSYWLTQWEGEDAK
ncbi:tagaturonate reductase [Paenibacillus pedocola]|uniref:tagaturonate reductase n=1 Tax=Paenibacillus pedocola TaxID=3242193 RepID=UPI00287772B9|nr:tagaturonate reductase [Paenibacillus typhae]